MSYPLTFEIEDFELPEADETESHCDCPKCRAKPSGGESEEIESWDELNFEDEFPEEETYGPPAASGGAEPWRLPPCSLWPGTTWEKICWAQNVLNRAAGASLSVDGRYGPLSCAAVQRFQGANRLKVDGIVGPETETGLIQAALNEIAKQSRVPVNGIMDARTVEEIRQFQATQRLPVDGRVGPVTRGAMIRALGGRACPPPPPPPPPPKPTRDREPRIEPIDPRPPVRPPTRNCDREQFNKLVKECDQVYYKCLAARCSFKWVVEQLKLVPTLVGCTRMANPYLIILCVLAKGGKSYIDNVFRALGCADTCRREAGTCRLNANSASGCF